MPDVVLQLLLTFVFTVAGFLTLAAAVGWVRDYAGKARPSSLPGDSPLVVRATPSAPLRVHLLASVIPFAVGVASTVALATFKGYSLRSELIDATLVSEQHELEAAKLRLETMRMLIANASLAGDGVLSDLHAKYAKAESRYLDAHAIDCGAKLEIGQSQPLALFTTARLDQLRQLCQDSARVSESIVSDSGGKVTPRGDSAAPR